jgi:2-iminobutanoate/2-iminopropanoate deaminase
MKTVIHSPKAPDPIGPYSQAIRSGNTIYISGQIPIDQDSGKLIIEDIVSETHQVMKNIGYVLKAAGLDYNNMVKCSIFIKNMSDFPQINEVYAQYFQTDPPARETMEVNCLPKNANIEISCIASSE